MLGVPNIWCVDVSGKLVIDATDDVPPPQDVMTTTKAAAVKEGGDDDEIYGAIDVGQGSTATNAKSAKDNDDEEGLMVGISQFWVCAMGHMEAVAELITERKIDCLENLTDVNFQEFEDGTGF